MRTDDRFDALPEGSPRTLTTTTRRAFLAQSGRSLFIPAVALATLTGAGGGGSRSSPSPTPTTRTLAGPATVFLWDPISLDGRGDGANVLSSVFLGVNGYDLYFHNTIGVAVQKEGPPGSSAISLLFHPF